MSWRSNAVVAGAIASVAILAACGGKEHSLDDLGLAGKKKGSNGRAGELLGGERNFALLINNHAKSTPKNIPWAGWWWAYTSNGIAKGGSGGSPAGKYDAVRGGRTDAQSWESQYHGPKVKGIQGWWGHCNGWSLAAALLPEPRESKTVNGITFSVADQKALVSEAGQFGVYDFYGMRYNPMTMYNDQAGLARSYDDVVADQVFLLLTNYMGMNKAPLLIDRDTGGEVWNQPLVAYQIEYPKPEHYLGPAPGTPNVYRIDVTMTIWWAEDGVDAGHISEPFNWQPAPLTEDRFGEYSTRTLRGEIWLDGPVVFDGSGKIVQSGNVIVARDPNDNRFYVGGAWKNGGGGQTHPDYIWVPTSIPSAFMNEYLLRETEDYEANPYIDIDWIKEHVLIGKDDPNVRSIPVPNAPTIQPSGSPGSTPTSTPTSAPTSTPTDGATPNPTPTRTWPVPWPTSTSNPQPGPTTTSPPPQPEPTSNPQPLPTQPPGPPPPPDQPGPRTPAPGPTHPPR